MKRESENKKNPVGGVKGSCESCEFYDYDEESDQYVCFVNLDQDEMADFVGFNTGRCPYFRFYDEYKSVQKQN